MCLGGSSQQGPTYDQQVQADINNKMWDYYQSTYKPVLDKYISSRTDPNTTELEKKHVAGQVNADVMKAARPQSATNAAVNTKNMMALSDVRASAKQSAEFGAEAHQEGVRENITNIGRGQVTKALTGLDELASMSVEAAARNEAREQELAGVEENAIGSAVGTAAGIGMSAYMNKSKTPAIPAFKQLKVKPDDFEFPDAP